jgi:hypothetical protein
MHFRRSTEKGQVLVLLVLAFVALLGFAALAIDGGMVYADKRRAQNGADAASLAGGGASALSLENDFVNYVNFTCTDNGHPEYGEILQAQALARAAAISRSADNDYVIDEDISDHNGVATRCGNEWTGSWFDKYIDITTTITSTTPTNFAHLIYGGPLRTRATAVTRVRPRAPLAFGNAIVALNPAACQGQQNGATFHGNGIVHVTGGGIFTNGCLRGDGNPSVTVIDGSINYVVEINDNAGFNPHPQQVPNPIPDSAYDVPPPNCASPAAHNVHASALVNTAQPLHGLYCATGNLRVNSHDTLIGDGVTIYMSNGEVQINGGATIQLTAPPRSPDPTPAIPGLLIYLPASNNNRVEINGNSSSFFTGTILAPGSNISVLGNGEVDAFRSQIIGWNVEVGGTADTYVLFDAAQLYSDPASLELFR